MKVEMWPIDRVNLPAVVQAATDEPEPFDRPPSQLGGNGVEFNLNAPQSMPQNGRDGFQAAADLWASILSDDILLYVDFNFTSLGGGIIIQTIPTTEGVTLPTLRTALSEGAKSLSDHTAITHYPTGSTIASVNVPGSVCHIQSSSAELSSCHIVTCARASQLRDQGHALMSALGLTGRRAVVIISGKHSEPAG